MKKDYSGAINLCIGAGLFLFGFILSFIPSDVLSIVVLIIVIASAILMTIGFALNRRNRGNWFKASNALAMVSFILLYAIVLMVIIITLSIYVIPLNIAFYQVIDIISIVIEVGALLTSILATVFSFLNANNSKNKTNKPSK
ncbi:MAG: hypothetical protein LBL60_01080 [Mycoplasmataceae bacterium]|jgi:predicted membrane metal-binding protein|nr:hypothetical protein [Mycoplasmataceae bacterium]